MNGIRLHSSATLVTAYDLLVSHERVLTRAFSVRQLHRERFGEAARALRIAKFGDRSLRTVARQLKISAAFLSQIELGERWSDDIARALKDFLINASPSSGETKP